MGQGLLRTVLAVELGEGGPGPLVPCHVGPLLLPPPVPLPCQMLILSWAPSFPFQHLLVSPQDGEGTLEGPDYFSLCTWLNTQWPVDQCPTKPELVG